MSSITIKEIERYVEENISLFHDNRLNKLKKLKLKTILRKKNPYLFKAKNLLTAQDLVKSILDAYLSSQEETLFGDFLEKLAVFINSRTFMGKKSIAEGIDLEFERDDKRYIVSIKSGPNWGNSSQVKKMIGNFKTAKKILRTGNFDIEIIAINGCCYGRDNKPDKGDYFKYCGQMFWSFISGIEELYTDIIEPLGYKAKQKNDSFIASYSQLLNISTAEFIKDFCVDGAINWSLLVKYSSAKEKIVI
jgi:hypothetical protein